MPRLKSTRGAVSTAIILVILIAAVRLSLGHLERPMLVLFIGPVLLATYLAGIRSGLLATGLLAMASSVLLLDLRHPENIDAADWLHLGIFTATGVLISFFVERARDSAAKVAALRHEAEENRLSRELARSLQLLKALSDATPDPFVVKDQDSRLLFLNPAGERFVGKPVAELIGKSERDWMSDKKQVEAIAENDRTVIETRSTRVVEEKITTAKGERIFLATKSPLMGPAGKAIGVVGVGKDITDQKRAENALRISERRFRRLYETKMLGMAFSTQDGKVIDANDAALEMLGFSREDLRAGIDWRKLTPKEFEERDRRAFAEIAEKGYCEAYEKVLRRKDGTEVAVLISGGTVEEPKNSSIIVLFDISNRKQAEKQLRESESRLMAILQALPVGVFIADTRGKLIHANPMAMEIWGGAPLVAVDQYREFKGWWPETGKRLESDDWALAKAIKRGETINDEVINIESFDGKAKVIRNFAMPVLSPNGDNLGGISVLEDITERKRVEKAAANELRWLETIINLIPVPIVLMHKDSGRTILNNKAADELAGGQYPEDAKNIATEMVLLDEQGDRIPFDRWPRTRAARGELINGESVTWSWRGRNTPLLVFAKPIPAVWGHSEMVIITYLDIRRLKDTERQLREAIRTRDDILSIVSHDLKNPISAIRLSADMLERSKTSPERLVKISEGIRRSAERILTLISNLLDISRMEAGTFEIAPEVCTAEGLFGSVIDELQLLADAKGVKLSDRIDCAAARVVCDRSRMTQVFSNIIGNALKFVSPDTGIVEVTSECTDEQVIFVISDNGPGIPVEDQPHIFDRFWHAKKSKSAGSGLGLAIAKGIIEAHSGRITVESLPGRGAKFCFSIPREHTKAAQDLLNAGRPEGKPKVA